MDTKETERKAATRSHERGFSLIESILIIVVFVVLGFTIYYFGSRAGEKAGAGALETDIKTVQNSIADYLLDSYTKTSTGLYPTDNGKLPATGEYKLILWTHSYNVDGKPVYFKDYFGKNRLPKHWDEGIWRIDNRGEVSVSINPSEY